MKEIQLHRIDLNLLVVFEALMLEGSVAGAAVRLNKTPSAISHSLARLREQVGDPLMVKVGGRMQASPFALQLVDDVRPILRSIKRALELPAPFDPATSDRTFRIASPISGRFSAAVITGLQSAAPGTRVEWLSTPREVYAAVAEGMIDLAHLGGERSLPQGLQEVEMPPLRFVSFVRSGHPGIAGWGPEIWARHGHVQVAIGNEVRSPVDAVSRDGRHVAALISEFAGVGPLLARSDLIATLPTVMMAWDMETHGLRPMPAFAPEPTLRARFFWSARTTKDPALVWFRDLVLRAYLDAHEQAERLVNARLGSGV